MTQERDDAVALAAALHRSSGLLTRALGEALPEASPAEALILAVLQERGATAVGELVTLLGMRPSTCTSVLDRLAERRHVVRQVRPDDRRSFLVLLTEAGRAQAEVVAVRLDELAATLSGETGSETIAALTRIADRLEG